MSDTSLQKRSSRQFLPSLRDSMCFGYFDLGLASEANAYHRFAILELAEDASSASSKRNRRLRAGKPPMQDR